MPHSTINLELRWAELKAEFPVPPLGEREKERLKSKLGEADDLLRDCIESGRSTADADDLLTLQWLARDVGDMIFHLTGQYRDTTIKPAAIADLPKLEQPPTKRAGRGRLPLVLVIALVVSLCALVATTILWLRQRGESELLEKESNSIKLELARQRKANDGWNDRFAASLSGEQLAIERSLSLIRDRRDPKSGAFILTANGTYSPMPEAGCLAALALLAAYERDTKRPDRAQDLGVVSDYVRWYAKAQNVDGSLEVAPDKATPKDTHRNTASAPRFLLVLDRYHRITGKLPQHAGIDQVGVAGRAVDSILDRIKDKDGIPYGDVKLTTKYLLGAIEDYAGLLAAARLFKRLEKKENADQYLARANTLCNGLGQFWREEHGLFAWNSSDGKYDTGLNNPSTQGRANLYGLTWLRPKEDNLRNRLISKFASETQPRHDDDGIPAEWWLVSSRPGDDSKYWRAETVRTTLTSFTSDTYLTHPAVVVLALLDGSSWLIPTEARTEP